MDDLQHPTIALLFQDGKLKYWNNDALKWLAKKTAVMLMSSNWKQYYYALKNKKRFKYEDTSQKTIWYDSGVGVMLGISIETGDIYVDG